LRNDDDDPPAQSFANVWQSRQDTPTDVLLDTDFDTEALIPPQATLPLYWLVDTKTMTIRATLEDPTAAALLDGARATLAALDGTPPPAPTPPAPLADGRFTAEQADMIAEMVLPAAPPADPSNAAADDPAAATLGQGIFSDTSLSPSGTVACASCHLPAKGFADGLPVPTAGAGPGDRNTPSVVLSSFARWQVWDGSADTEWMQATFPLEGPNELASSRLFIAHALAARYASAWAGVFGALPDLSDTTRFPPSGAPGDPAYDGMAPADQQTVTRILVDVAKALAAYERTLRAGQLPLDAYAAGTTSALTDPQKDGLAAFFTAGCAQCHWGPRLTDDAFHNPRFPTGRHDGAADTGRNGGIPIFNASAFQADGPYSDESADAGARAVPQLWDWTLGVFKTPPLRGVADTAPYGHGGTFVGLADVVAAHATAPLSAADPRAAGTRDDWFLAADAATQASIVTFLSSLTLNMQ
jgi:cytochrome c peroxidase